MFFEMTKKAGALLVLAALSACGGGGGGNPPPVATVADAQRLEGASGTSVLSFRVTFDRAHDSPLPFTYSTASTAKAGGGSTGTATAGPACAGSVDHVRASAQVLTIASGRTTADVRITVCGDAVFEPLETLALDWSVGNQTGTAIGTILNDDSGGLNGTGVAGSFGRDSNPLTNADADGRAGFSFAKAPSATNWRCTRDEVTGLLWEAKAAGGGGLNDATRTYTWAQLGAFVAAVNAQALCGFTDWSLPSPEELSSLVDAGTTDATTIDSSWFPNQQDDQYWTSTTYRDGTGDNAWYVDFATGTVAFDNKARAFHARLVTRGGTTAAAPLPTSCTDSRRFSDHGDGTVSDRRTGLMWKKCAEGFSGSACSGTGVALAWSAAVARPAAVNADADGAGLGYGDWRLPTRTELSSIAEREQCFNPAINSATFPNAEALGYWTSTPYASNSNLAWNVDFFDGQVAPGTKAGLGSSSKRVRLVRAGQ